MKRFLLFASDIFALYFSLYLTLWIRYGSELGEKIGIHIIPFSIVFLFWVIIFYISNLYELVYLKNDFHYYSRFFQSIALSAGLSVVFFYLIPFFGITPKTNLFIFIIIFTAINFLFRSIYNNVISSQTFKNNTIIIGLNQQSIELAKFIKKNPQLGYRLKYIADISQSKLQNTLSEFGIINYTDLERIIKREKIGTVVLSPQAYKIPGIIDIFYKSLGKKINFYNLSDFYEHTTGKIPLGAIDQIWFLEKLTEGTKKPYEIIKRIFDVISSIIFGAVMLLLLPFIALIIKIDSKGPVFYRQRRVGQYEKEFDIIKFRTMVEDAEKESGAVWAKKDDPRATKFGKLLRKTRLDELPQIWNILKGEMSLIGPRAERPEFHEKLKKNISFYKQRYIIRPGLTGWAQIQYRYGASVKDAEEKLQNDLFYIKNRSLALDLSIALKTINIVLRQAGR